ncbi:MAG: proprotein convertase P-domain-containing protein [Chitinophagales bacterium]
MKKLTLCFLACFLCFNAWAQNTRQLAKTTIPLSKVERITLPKVNNKLLKEKELEQRAKTKARAIQFAEPIEVSITPQTNGTWEYSKNGNAVWRLKLYSANALSLNLGFTQFFLPKSSRFFIYTPDRENILGPFTANDNDLHKQLWTPIIEGDEVVLELQIERETLPELLLELGSVNHDFMGLGQKLLSGSCNVDVVCGTADGLPRVDEYRDIIRSAAAYSIGGTFTCSGALVNNTRNDGTPYFLTADHCGLRGGNAPSVVVYWNYQNSYCRQPNSPESGNPGDGILTDFNSGATLKATYAQTDFTLIELDDEVSETAQAFFAGWDREGTTPSGAIGIHHPGVEEKRISFENDGLTTGSWSGTPESHLVVNDWDTGTTEPGSSGSPIFNLNKQIVGQLSGGGAACGNDLSDSYGWFSVSWEGGGSPQTRLRDWLDPDDSGLIDIDGKDGSYGLALTESFIEICNQNIDDFDLEFTLTDNFVGNVGVYFEEIPVGLQVVFGANPVETGGTTSIAISNLSSLAAGTYSIEFFASDGFDTGSSIFTFTIIEDIPDAPSLMEPTSDQTEVTTNPTYEWATIVDVTYSLEVALDENFTNVVITENNLNDETYSGITLETETVYYWRTKATNACGEGEWSEAFRFTTADIRCAANSSTDLPVNIPPFPPQTVTSTLEVNELGTIADIDVVDLRGSHSYIGDLEFELESPSGTRVVLIEGECGDNANFDVNFSDQAAGVPPCPYTDGGTYRPAEALSAFNGEDPTGTWTLRVRDNFPGDGGTLESWALQICTVPNFELFASTGVTACVGTSVEIPIQLGGAFDDTGVNMSINGLPDGAELSFDQSPAEPGSVVTAMITNLDAIGIYALTVSASDGAHNSFTQINLTVLPPVASAPAPNLPADETTLVGLTTSMNWGIMGGITGYHIEIATDPDFTNILVSEIIPTIDYDSPDLEGSTTYYWRVSGVNVCGDGPWSEVFSFRTPQLICGQDSSEGAVEIGEGPPGVYTSSINITARGPIIDVNVSEIVGTHSFVGDLNIRLISPTGTAVNLLLGECDDADDFNVGFDDEANSNITCPISEGNTHRPAGNLSDFIGEDAEGLWVLRIEDTGNFDGGELESWQLQICTEPDFSLTSLSEVVTACPNEIANFSIEIGGGFDATAGVGLTAEGLPMGATVEFSEDLATPGSVVEVSVGGLTDAGDYTIVLTATDGIESSNTEVNITVLDAIMAATSLTSPTDGSTLSAITTNLEWAGMADVSDYNVEVSTTGDFSTIMLSESITGGNTFDTPILDGNTIYFWRVQGANECGVGPWTEAFSFTTPNIVCSQAQNLDAAIEIEAANPQTYNSTITVAEQGIILDVDVSANGIHSYIGDLTFTLISPTGTEVVLVDRQCTESETFNIGFDDESVTTLTCPYDDGGSYIPITSLAAFDGELAMGTWTLRVRDNAEQDGGSLEAWSLNLCVEPQDVVAPVSSFTVGIDGFNVFASDKSEGATSWVWDFGDNTTFEGQNPPIHTYAGPGDYEICLTVTNSAGTNETCQTVSIIDTAIDPILANNLIRFYPNPTNHLLNIDFDTSLQMDVTMEIYGVNGQLVFQRELNSTETTITAIVDLSNFSTGVYMVRLTSDDWTVTKKVVKE